MAEILRGIAKSLTAGEITQRPLDFQSGDQFKLVQSHNEFEIRDPENGQYFFQAKIRANGNVRFEVRTKNQAGEYHPELYAKDLYRVALQHFQSLGIDVSRVTSVWVNQPGFNDNLLQFRKNRIWLGKFDRATQTPEGKVLTTLGYVPKTIETPTKNEVNIDWIKART